jgi:hypothetical protein
MHSSYYEQTENIKFSGKIKLLFITLSPFISACLCSLTHTHTHNSLFALKHYSYINVGWWRRAKCERSEFQQKKSLQRTVSVLSKDLMQNDEHIHTLGM